MSGYYESSLALYRLLYEQYGMFDQISPVNAEARSLCGSMNSRVDEALRGLYLPCRERALDLGCGTGRNSFELKNYFKKVIGIDRSTTMLTAARSLQRDRMVSATYQPGGFEPQTCYVLLPGDCVTDGVEFFEGDAANLSSDLGIFDLVFMDKLLECLPDPEPCLRRIPDLIAPGGCLVHISLYWWTSECTAPEKWLGTPDQTLAKLDQIFSPHLTRERRFKVPHFVQSYVTWFTYGVAEACIWRRR